MATKSEGVPPHLVLLLNRLTETGTLFIEVYKPKAERMQEISRKLAELSKLVNKVQKDSNSTRKFWTALGGVGVAVGVSAGILGVSGESTTKLAVIGGAAAIVGVTGVVTVNVIKAQTEKRSVEKVEKLGKEFRAISELLLDFVTEIKSAAEELKEKSSFLRAKTGTQAKSILYSTKRLQELLVQSAEMAERSKRVLDVTATTLGQVTELLNVIMTTTRVTPSYREDAKLIKVIKGTAGQTKLTVVEFEKMRALLADFEKVKYSD